MIKKIFLLPILFLVITACNKKNVVEPGFSVITDPAVTTLKANVPVTFLFTGNPDYITFYSGETGHEYQYKDRITAGVKTDIGTPIKNMTTKFTSYTYTFAAAGTYKVTFDASNTNIYGVKEDVKELDITVAP